MSFVRADSAAIEVTWNPGTSGMDVTLLANECLALGFRRISLDVDRGDFSDLRYALRLVESLPGALLILRTTTDEEQRFLRSTTSHRLVVRTCAREFEGASEYIDIGTSVLMEAAPRQVHELLVEWPGYKIIFDLSEEPADLGVLARPGGRGGVRIWDDIVSSRLLREHPCHAYLCPVAKCHVGRVSWPRRVTVSPAGEIAPYGLRRSSGPWGEVRSAGEMAKILEAMVLDRRPTSFRWAARDALGAFVSGAGFQTFSMNAILRASSRLSC